MKLYSVRDFLFHQYGQILSGYDFGELFKVLEKTPIPENEFLYMASEPRLEELPVFMELQDRAYGGLPMQLGYCNGINARLNCLEYHRNSELLIAAYDTILLLGKQENIDAEGIYDTADVRAFLLPAGMGVELFATTLHYAPCSPKELRCFRVANGLPRGTNGLRPDGVGIDGEDALLLGRNKWLLAHPESTEAKEGAPARLNGWNVDIWTLGW